VYEKVYPLEALVTGLDDLEQRRTWGKAVARIRPDDRGAAKAKL
jgi:NADPH:quinone reductase